MQYYTKKSVLAFFLQWSVRASWCGPPEWAGGPGLCQYNVVFLVEHIFLFYNTLSAQLTSFRLCKSLMVVKTEKRLELFIQRDIIRTKTNENNRMGRKDETEGVLPATVTWFDCSFSRVTLSVCALAISSLKTMKTKPDSEKSWKIRLKTACLLLPKKIVFPIGPPAVTGHFWDWRGLFQLQGNILGY